MLAVDTINPVKIVLHVFPFVVPWHVATMCALLGMYVFVKDMKDLLYFSVKVFFHSILSIFFRDVEIVGVQNIPVFGPCIFSVNHANQFVDAVMLVCTGQRPVSYLMAEHSYQRRVIGDLAWALGVVPVRRPQDFAKPGMGTITMVHVTEEEDEDALLLHTTSSRHDDEDEDVNPAPSFRVTGYETCFRSQLQVGDKIRPMGTSIALKVLKIIHDTSLVVDATDVPVPTKTLQTTTTTPVTFDILKRVDQHVVFEKVLEKLASGGAIGIFPEGGSHDRTDLLPLKVGVALIAYSALEKDGINVPIVPVGLNYFQAHRWRGRAVVEFGRPIRINPATLKAYVAGGRDRRKVCTELLERVQDSMKSVIVSAPDYETLQVIHTARRLYQRKGQTMEPSAKQDLNRRFAEGYKRLLLMTDGNPPKEWLELQDRLIAYHRELTHLGIKDYHVPALNHGHSEHEKVDGDVILGYMDTVYQILHLLLLLLLAAVPTLFINLPIGVLAGMHSESRRKVLLSQSKVKVRAYDVVLTEKILFCIVMIPCLWTLYGFLLYYCTDMDGPTLALTISSMPLFAYVGIIVTEAGMVDANYLRPWVMKLFPSSRKRLAALPETRLNLQRDLRRFIKKLGPVLGEIYYKKDLDWGVIQEKARAAAALPLSSTTTQQETTRHRRRGTETSETFEIPTSEEDRPSDVKISRVPPTIDDLNASFIKFQELAESHELTGNDDDEGGNGMGEPSGIPKKEN
jgi:glycerol-3-phosphate O-acyltransferase / dihydroxyacetone phosphate acyltransferase